MKITMFLYLPTNVVFENRKQCVMTMGISRYRRELKKHNFDFSIEPKRKKAQNLNKDE